MRGRFNWSDFILPSTLQLTASLKILLEPVRHLKNIDQIELGLQEALVNAVRHGNSCDADKSLRVRRIKTPHWFVWQIQDEGNGIPLSSRKFCLPSELDANNGRGLFLIYNCFDDVRWSNKGNRLQVASRR